MAETKIDKATFDMSSLLDSTIDDLADTPEFKAWPAGGYQFSITLLQSPKLKDNKPEPVFIGKLKCIQTIELDDPTAVPVENGTECQIRFQMDNEYGQGDFKKVSGVIAAKFGCKSIREVLEVTKDGIVCNGVLTQREGKERPDKTKPTFTSILEMEVA